MTAGDLFLFFGWFRQVERTDGRYRFVRGAPDLHVLFGWLQIGAILPVNGQETHAPPWAAYHPHLHYGPVRGNILYMARETLELGGLRTSVPGGGAFARYDERLCLTAPGHTRATWRLPVWFHPGDGRTPLSYHADPKRWQAGDGCALLRSVCQGQEFVLDADQYPETLAWARTLIAGSSHEFHE